MSRPYSSPDYPAIAKDVGQLVEQKQEQYGDSISKTEAILKIHYPNGIPVDAYSDLLLMVRVIDKQCRISHAKGAKDKGDESPWLDIAGYSILGLSIAKGGG